MDSRGRCASAGLHRPRLPLEQARVEGEGPQLSSPYAPTDLTDVQPTPMRTMGAPTTSTAAGWSVPPGTAEAAKPKPTAADALAEDAAPPPWPDGAPELTAFLKLPFRQRGQFMAQMGPLQERIAALPSKGTKAGLAEAAVMFDTLADIDDLLRLVAADESTYTAWVAEAGDAEFMDLFSAYFARSQPGEAPSSSS